MARLPNHLCRPVFGEELRMKSGCYAFPTVLSSEGSRVQSASPDKDNASLIRVVLDRTPFYAQVRSPSERLRRRPMSCCLCVSVLSPTLRAGGRNRAGRGTARGQGVRPALLLVRRRQRPTDPSPTQQVSDDRRCRDRRCQTGPSRVRCGRVQGHRRGRARRRVGRKPLGGSRCAEFGRPLRSRPRNTAVSQHDPLCGASD